MYIVRIAAQAPVRQLQSLPVQTSILAQDPGQIIEALRVIRVEFQEPAIGLLGRVDVTGPVSELSQPQVSVRALGGQAHSPFEQSSGLVELRPPLDVTKGSSVLSLAEEWGLRGALYIGDDQTDVDAFRAFHKYMH